MLEHFLHVMAGPETKVLQRELERHRPGTAEPGAEHLQGHGFPFPISIKESLVARRIFARGWECTSTVV
jgi:hypothetical protein